MKSRKPLIIILVLIVVMIALSVSFGVYRSGALARLFGGRADEIAPVGTLEFLETQDAKTEESKTFETETSVSASFGDELISKEDLQVHFIDVGQGDCTLIMCGGEAMLIDAGGNAKGTQVQLYLQKQGVKELKYVIGTHPDADHIGGLDVIITKFECDTVIMPDYSVDTATFRDVMDAVRYKGYKVTYPDTGDTYELGKAVFTILGPLKKYGDSNNNSVAIKLTYGNNSLLFTGDCEKEAETDIAARWQDIHADVYKVGHHGSSTSSSEEFLEKVRPAYAVISCGADNDYGHPHEATLERLESCGAQIIRTDESGTVVMASDGNVLVFCSLL